MQPLPVFSFSDLQHELVNQLFCQIAYHRLFMNAQISAMTENGDKDILPGIMRNV